MSSKATDPDKVNPKAGPHRDHVAKDDGGDEQHQNQPEAKVSNVTYEAHKSKTTDKKDSTAKSTGAEASVDDRLATEVYSTTFNGLPFKMEVRVRSYDECDVKVTVGAEVQHHELTKADTKLVIDEWNKGLAVLATMTKLGDEMIAGLRRPLAEWLVEFEEGIDKLSENGVLEMAPPLSPNFGLTLRL